MSQLPSALLALTDPGGDPRPGRCCYCGRQWLRVGDPPDHFMLESLGARLGTDRACWPCNQLLNELVDRPLLDDWLLAIKRQRAGIVDRRRGGGRARRARGPRMKVELPDGTPVQIDFESDELVPAQIAQGPDGLVVLGGTAVQRAELIAEHRKRERGRPLTEIDLGNRLQLSGARVQTRVWARYCARAALGAVSLLHWDEAWLDGATATRLRGWVFDDAPTSDTGEPVVVLPRRPPPWLKRICHPGEHRAVFYPGQPQVGTQSALHIGLFGEDWFSVMVDSEGHGPVARRAWRLPIGAAPIETDFTDVADEAYLAAVGIKPDE